LDAHVIVWEGGGWECDTGIAGVEEWEWDVEDGSLEVVGFAKTNESANVTDHIVVTVLFAFWCGESSPEIKMVVIEASSDEVIESEAAFTDDCVSKVSSPSDCNTCFFFITRADTGCRASVSDCNFWEFNTKPGLEEIITSTGDLYRPFSTECR